MISLRDVVTGFGNRDPLAEVWRRDLRGGGGGAAEITGVPPLRYIGDGRPLTDYRISGNTVQDGTPSADAPVDAAGCGVRTGNLFDKNTDIIPGIIRDDINDFGGTNLGNSILFMHDGPAETYTVTRIFGYNLKVGEFDAYPKVGDVANMLAAIKNGTTITFTTSPGKKYIVIYFWQINAPNTLEETVASVMLNLGSEALPYEPYGYKLPLTVNGTEYPIYLGQVETTRRIKKLVLTGEEDGNWIRNPAITSGNAYYNTSIFANYKTRSGIGYCTHYPLVTTASAAVGVYFGAVVNIISAFSEDLGTTEKWKAYLAQQYAAGTPVTVWYVLATPETAIVNEPLMKIGDYADTISFAQAQVTIPTVNGENILDVPTEVKPSEVTIKGGISSV